MFFETKNLCFSHYKQPLCLKDINFSFAENSKILILASKDSGKTTMLKVLSGFEDSRFGNIYLNGVELKQIADQDKNFSLILSDSLLLENKTIKQNIDYLCSVLEIENLTDEQINLYLKDFEISRELSVKVKKLTMLEKRKLQIVRAVIKNSTIIFLDDIFEGLNDEEIESMFKIYKRLISNSRLTIVSAIGDETYKKINNELKDLKFDKFLYLIMAEINEFKSFEEFENSFKSIDMFKFLSGLNTETGFIEFDKNGYFFCQNEEKIFKFDNCFNKKLLELKLGFGETEDVVLILKTANNLKEIEIKYISSKIKNGEIIILSNLTGFRII